MPPFLYGKSVWRWRETGLTMQVMGWISIITGLLHFRKAAGLMLILIGAAVLFAVWRSKKNEFSSTHRTIREKIIMTRRLRRGQEIAGRPKNRDFPGKGLPTRPELESKGEKKPKRDWFIYTK
ncbi:MAG: hypothetical protein L7F78_26590 [Syntrophales bacterium LBB04]|nr:hypothetical protein [Syntrophales bacterium LBB04]